MDSTSSARKSKGVSFIGALAGMLVTFVGGVYVGLHPEWIPIHFNSSTGTPDKLAPMQPEHPSVTSRPTTNV